MIRGQTLEGALPDDAGLGRDLALDALTRRVAELEHRLNVMKIIVGAVLAVKVLFVVLFIYILFGGAFIRGGGSLRTATQPAALLQQ